MMLSVHSYTRLPQTLNANGWRYRLERAGCTVHPQLNVYLECQCTLWLVPTVRSLTPAPPCPALKTRVPVPNRRRAAQLSWHREMETNGFLLPEQRRLGMVSSPIPSSRRVGPRLDLVDRNENDTTLPSSSQSSLESTPLLRTSRYQPIA